MVNGTTLLETEEEEVELYRVEAAIALMAAREETAVRAADPYIKKHRALLSAAMAAREETSVRAADPYTKKGRALPSAAKELNTDFDAESSGCCMGTTMTSSERADSRRWKIAVGLNRASSSSSDALHCLAPLLEEVLPSQDEQFWEKADLSGVPLILLAAPGMPGQSRRIGALGTDLDNPLSVPPAASKDNTSGGVVLVRDAWMITCARRFVITTVSLIAGWLLLAVAFRLGYATHRAGAVSTRLESLWRGALLLMCIALAAAVSSWYRRRRRSPIDSWLALSHRPLAEDDEPPAAPQPLALLEGGRAGRARASFVTSWQADVGRRLQPSTKPKSAPPSPAPKTKVSSSSPPKSKVSSPSTPPPLPSCSPLPIPKRKLSTLPPSTPLPPPEPLTISPLRLDRLPHAKYANRLHVTAIGRGTERYPDPIVITADATCSSKSRVYVGANHRGWAHRGSRT